MGKYLRYVHSLFSLLLVDLYIIALTHKVEQYDLDHICKAFRAEHQHNHWWIVRYEVQPTVSAKNVELAIRTVWHVGPSNKVSPISFFKHVTYI
jgi:hypothetical protein